MSNTQRSQCLLQAPSLLGRQPNLKPFNWPCTDTVSLYAITGYTSVHTFIMLAFQCSLSVDCGDPFNFEWNRISKEQYLRMHHS